MLETLSRVVSVASSHPNTGYSLKLKLTGKTVFIPFTKLPKEPHTMKMLRLKSEAELDSLKPNSWGIPEHDTDQDVEEGERTSTVSINVAHRCA